MGLKVLRVQKDGHYHHGVKMTVIVAIEPGSPALPSNVCGSLECPQRWIKCLRAIGTTINIFRDFCNYVCRDIEMNNVPGTDAHWIFIWDKLAMHHSAYVHGAVMNRDGPIQASFLLWHDLLTIQNMAQLNTRFGR
jgi:hypothetical protein